MQLDLEPLQDPREQAEALHADGTPIREIARLVRKDPATIRRWLDPRHQPRKGQSRIPTSCEHLIDAGLAWHNRVGVMPNSSSWNATRVRRKGGIEFQRFLEGWGPPGKCAWRAWPQPHDVNKRFGSWASFETVLAQENDRRRVEDDPYRPRHPPTDRARFAALVAYATSVLELALKPSRVIRVSIDPAFVEVPEGYMDLRADTRRRDVAIVGDPGTGRSSLLAGIVMLDRFREQRVVVIQRERAALIASGLPTSAVFDLKETMRFEKGAIVCSDDPEVRLIAVHATVQASRELDRHICIAIDDADDLVADLAGLMRFKPATAHMAVVWTPRMSLMDSFLWVAQQARVNLGVNDPAVDALYRHEVDPALQRQILGLPPEGTA